LKPKFVLVILLLGVAALALMGIIHGVVNKREGPAQPPPVVPPEKAEASQTTSNVPVNAQATSNIAMTANEQTAFQKQKDLDAVNDALLSSDGDPRAMLEVASRLENSDAEVRTAARESAVHLGDTNIIPYLNSALNNLKDPREKVAIMDAIAYLQIPSAAETARDPALESILTNSAPIPRRLQPMDPAAALNAKRRGAAGTAPAAPAQTPPAAAPQGSP
jgi:flagellar basal body-associated protein FliL